MERAPISKDGNLHKWFPFPANELDTMYDVHSVELSGGKLIVTMLPNGKRNHELNCIRLSWEIFISYQVSEETFRDDCWVGNPQDAWSFWAGDNSQYLQSFKAASTLFPDKAMHYLFVGTNLIADILAVGKPKIEYCDLELLAQPGKDNHPNRDFWNEKLTTYLSDCFWDNLTDFNYATCHTYFVTSDENRFAIGSPELGAFLSAGNVAYYVKMQISCKAPLMCVACCK